MDYREAPPPPHLDGLIKARWTLAGTGAADAWIEQRATPDGCVEIIERSAGRSRWNGDQPARFAVGLAERPEAFEISGDSRFEGLRIWPWAWALIGEPSLAAMRGRWLPYDGPDLDAVALRLETAPALNAIGRAIIAADSVDAMAAGTGMAPRTLQRWFAARVGMPPRRYLRLIRFQKAFEQIPSDASLAEQAAAQGFSDQAHMARTFREMAGVPATRARRAARGPFLT